MGKFTQLLLQFNGISDIQTDTCYKFGIFMEKLLSLTDDPDKRTIFF